MARQLTITFDDDVAEMLEEVARSKGTTIDMAANEATRRGIVTELSPFRIEGRLLEAREGVSFECIGRLTAESDDEMWRR